MRPLLQNLRLIHGRVLVDDKGSQFDLLSSFPFSVKVSPLLDILFINYFSHISIPLSIGRVLHTVAQIKEGKALLNANMREGDTVVILTAIHL